MHIRYNESCKLFHNHTKMLWNKHAAQQHTHTYSYVLKYSLCRESGALLPLAWSYFSSLGFKVSQQSSLQSLRPCFPSSVSTAPHIPFILQKSSLSSYHFPHVHGGENPTFCPLFICLSPASWVCFWSGVFLPIISHFHSQGLRRTVVGFCLILSLLCQHFLEGLIVILERNSAYVQRCSYCLIFSRRKPNVW